MNRRCNSSSQSRSRHEALESRRLLAFGALDTSFSQDGKTTLDLGGITVSAHDVAVQSDGKTIVVGGSSDWRIALARFNLDGTIDQSFGFNQNGTVLQRIGTSTNAEAYGNAVELQSDGKIVVAAEYFDGS